MSVGGPHFRNVLLVFLLAGGGPAAVLARDPGVVAVRKAAREYFETRKRGILNEVVDLVSIPNVASDTENILRNARMLEKLMNKRGIRTRLLEVEGSPPVVYGELPAPGARRTVVLYAHYDGQPAVAEEWQTDPWQPVVRDPRMGARARDLNWWIPGIEIEGEWRMYGRSVSDDKAPIIGLLAAIDSLRRAEIPLSVNLKFFLDGEEENGSPHLAEILEAHADLLRGDLWLICDGPVHQSRRMQVFFGARGVTGVEMTVFGPNRPLHSGHYGNWAPNPVVALVQLLASMRDPDGRIRIKGFDDQVRNLTKTELQALEGIPDLREDLMDELGLARTEGKGESLETLIMRPAANIRGIQAGGVREQARNAIPTEAHVSIDFRLVPDQTPEYIRERVEEHIRKQGFHIVTADPDPETRRGEANIIRLQWGHGYPAARTRLDLPVSRGLVRAVEGAMGEPIVELPTLGGSVPLYLIQDLLGAEAIGVPIVNHDNNQHARDENLRLQNLWDGIGVFAAILARLGHLWDEDVGS
jgi:acetylornithine deacetylase/succinyl-diaminopimelate desuccinylase-like protein